MSSLTLGNKIFSTHLIQGPLAGVSCAPFRLLTWEHSQPAYTCTEMISCKTLIHSPKESHYRFVKKDPKEGPVCFQLSGNDPIELAEAVKVATDYGADLIDLNCGCPVNKIRKKGAGSKLLSDASRLYQLISAMKKNTQLPVSIKIRVDGGSKENFNQEIARVINDAGLDFLVVHGRHWTEHYETPCRYDQIQFFVEALKMPVIGNGDIKCINSYKKMLATGCAGVMIGRGSVGQPWLIKKLRSDLANEIYQEPAIQEVGQMFLQHVRQLVTLLGREKFALLQARTFANYYARRLIDKTVFCERINSCEKIENLESIVRECYNLTII